MATRQQRIQQERQRQREEAAARQQLPDRPLGAEALDAIERDVATFVQLPGVRQTLGFAAGAVNMVNEAVLEPARYAATDPSQAGTPLALAGTALTFGEGLMEKSAEGAAILAEKMGVDPRIGGFVGGTAAETLLTAGLGAAGRKITQAVDMIPPGGTMPQAVMAGAAPMQPMAVSPSFERGGLVMKATTSPEFTGPGMGQGVAKSPKYAGTVESYMESVPTFSDAAAEIERRFAAGEITASRRKNALSKLKKKADAELSTFAYDPENPPVYAESSRTKATREAQIPDPIAELITEKPAKAHQHHYLAKAQTRPFVDKMLELVNNNVADLDDLVNFFTWPEQYQLYPGNVRSNMADLSPRAHVPSEAVTEFDRKFNVHRMLQDVGLEVKSGTKGGATDFINKNYGLQNVKTADDLMRSWDQFLQEIGIPGKESAKTIQEFFLTEYRKGLSGDKLKQFNEMAAKLYK